MCIKIEPEADLYELSDNLYEESDSSSIKTKDIDFNDLKEDLVNFQQVWCLSNAKNQTIQEALSQEKDLRIFNKEIQKQLSNNSSDIMVEYLLQADSWANLNT